METLTDQNWLLTLGTFLPLLGAMVMMFWPKDDESGVKTVGIVTAGATLLVGIYTLVQFDYSQSEKLQFAVDAEWIEVIRSGFASVVFQRLDQGGMVEVAVTRLDELGVEVPVERRGGQGEPQLRRQFQGLG